MYYRAVVPKIVYVSPKKFLLKLVSKNENSGDLPFSLIQRRNTISQNQNKFF